MTKAIILSGGWGTRLRPLTCTTPKALVPVVNIPVIERLMLLLKEAGVKEIVLAVSVMSEYLSNYFGNGDRLGLKLHYTNERKPMGTAGALKLAEELLDNDNFFMINGDIIINFVFKKMLDTHNTKDDIGLIASRTVKNPSRYGVLISDKKKKIAQFLEKDNFNPSIHGNSDMPVNAGIYILEPEIFQYIQSNKNLSLERDIFPILASENKLSHYPITGIWKDIGLPFQLLEGNILFMKDIIDKRNNNEKNIIDKNVQINSNVKIDPPITIGKNVKIGKDSIIGPNVIIGENVEIGNHCKIKDSLIYKNVIISENSDILKSIIADHSIINKNTTLKGNKKNLVIISSYVQVNENIKIISPTNHSISICPHEIVKKDII
ncbi:MAG: NDP-sugar synthase [Candidatus Lokiarchaeota archaeon]|nr:NDP-sugar synthase [Candidatus Lokiarchaeota archaeon]